MITALRVLIVWVSAMVGAMSYMGGTGSDSSGLVMVFVAFWGIPTMFGLFFARVLETTFLRAFSGILVAALACGAWVLTGVGNSFLYTFIVATGVLWSVSYGLVHLTRYWKTV